MVVIIRHEYILYMINNGIFERRWRWEEREGGLGMAALFVEG